MPKRTGVARGIGEAKHVACPIPPACVRTRRCRSPDHHNHHRVRTLFLFFCSGRKFVLYVCTTFILVSSRYDSGNRVLYCVGAALGCIFARGESITLSISGTQKQI